MTTRRLERYAPLAGVLFLVLVLAILSTNDSPKGDQSTAEVVAYWRSHDGQEIAGAGLGALAAISLVWFGASVRDAIAAAEGGTGRLAALSFAGTVLAAAGLTTTAMVGFAAASTAGDVPREVTHTLSVLYAESILSLMPGFVLLLLASGLAALRTGVLPRWLGWTQLLSLALLITPLGFGAVYFATVVWVAGVGVLLFARGGAAPPAQEPPDERAG